MRYAFSYWGKKQPGQDDKGPRAVMTSALAAVEVSSVVSAGNDTTEEKVVNKVEEVVQTPRRHQYSRSIEFQWPALYSFCIQHIVSERYEGYYCPPVLNDEDEEVDEGEVVDEKAVQEETKWLCCFRPVVKTVDAEDESGSRKKQKINHK